MASFSTTFQVEVKDVTADQHTRTTKEIQYRFGLAKNDDTWALFKTERELEAFGVELKKELKTAKLDMPKLKPASKKVLKSDSARGSRARELDEFFNKLFRAIGGSNAHWYAAIRDFCALDEKGNYIYGPAAKAEQAAAEAEKAAAEAEAAAAAAAAQAAADAEAAAAAAKAAEPKPIMVVQAIAPYTGRPGKHELSFAAGQIIKILNQTSASWWLGKIGDNMGYIPATYTSLVATMGDESGGDGGDASAASSVPDTDDDEETSAPSCWVCGEEFGSERSANVKGHDVHADRRECLARLPAKLKEEKNKAEQFITTSMLQSDSVMLDQKMSKMGTSAAGTAKPGQRRATITLDDTNSSGSSTTTVDGLNTSSPSDLTGLGMGGVSVLPPGALTKNPTMGHLGMPGANGGGGRARSSSIAIAGSDGGRFAGPPTNDSSDDLMAALSTAASGTPPMSGSALAAVPDHDSSSSSGAGPSGGAPAPPPEKTCVLDQPDVYARKLYAGSYVFDQSNPQPSEVVVYVQGDRVIGGELAALVAQVLETEDADFVSDFLYVHSSFIESVELLRALMYQIAPFAVPDHKPSSPVHAEGPPAQYAENALYVLTAWVAEHFPDFKKQEGLMDNLVRFHVTALLGSGTVTPEGKQAFSRTLADVQSLPMRGIDIFADKWELPPGESNPITWDRMDVVTLAQQATLLEYEIFATIEPREVLSGKWGKSDTAGIAIHVTRLIDMFNTLSRWVVAEILKISKVKKRAEMVVKFIDLANEFMKVRNFNGVLEIVSGLGASEIHRLKKTWSRVPEEKQNVLGYLRVLVSRDKNFKFLRDKLLSTSLPCLPYLGMFLTDLTFVIDGNKSVIRDDVINYSKWLHCARILKQMRVYQEATYADSIDKDHYVIHWLENSLDGIGEAEAYELSLKLEPRK